MYKSYGCCQFIQSFCNLQPHELPSESGYYIISDRNVLFATEPNSCCSWMICFHSLGEMDTHMGDYNIIPNWDCVLGNKAYGVFDTPISHW